MANKSRAYFFPAPAVPVSGGVVDYFTPSDAVFLANTPGYSLAKNDHALAVFADGEDSSLDFWGVTKNAGMLNLAIFWAATSVMGQVNWSVAWELDNELGVDLNVSSFSAPKTQTGLAPPLLGQLRKTVIPFTAGERGGQVVGDPYRFRVRRQAGVGLDTMVGDAQLFRVSLEAP